MTSSDEVWPAVNHHPSRVTNRKATSKTPARRNTLASFDFTFFGDATGAGMVYREENEKYLGDARPLS